MGALTLRKWFVTIGTMTVTSKSGCKPHVKLKLPSCEKVGRAVTGMPATFGIPRVVKIELYETRPPPGNNGGAVSGAGPCARVGAQSKSPRLHIPLTM